MNMFQDKGFCQITDNSDICVREAEIEVDMLQKWIWKFMNMFQDERFCPITVNPDICVLKAEMEVDMFQK